MRDVGGEGPTCRNPECDKTLSPGFGEDEFHSADCEAKFRATDQLLMLQLRAAKEDVDLLAAQVDAMTDALIRDNANQIANAIEAYDPHLSNHLVRLLTKDDPDVREAFVASLVEALIAGA